MSQYRHRDPAEDGDRCGLQQLSLKVLGGAPPFTWLVDGAPIGRPVLRRATQWRPGGIGFMRISVIDATGASDSVSVRLE